MVNTPNFGQKVLRLSQGIRQVLDGPATVLPEILPLSLKPFLVDFLTLSIFEQRRVKIPNFEQNLLRLRLSLTENLDAVTAVLWEILTFQLKSFLVDFLTLNISEQKVVKIPNLGEELFRSRLSITENLNILPCVLSEMWTLHLRSFLVVFLTFSTSEQKGVKIPNFEEELLRSRLSLTGNLDALTAALCEILTFQLKSPFVNFLRWRSFKMGYFLHLLWSSYFYHDLAIFIPLLCISSFFLS